MKVRFLSWFLLILCTQSATIFGFEGFPTSKIEGFNLSKRRFGGQIHMREASVNITNALYEEIDRRELKGEHEIADSVKGQKGKGTYGGGNPSHHPHSNKGAASLSASPCYLLSEAVLNASLALIGQLGLLLPYFLTGF